MMKRKVIAAIIALSLSHNICLWTSAELPPNGQAKDGMTKNLRTEGAAAKAPAEEHLQSQDQPKDRSAEERAALSEDGSERKASDKHHRRRKHKAHSHNSHKRSHSKSAESIEPAFSSYSNESELSWDPRDKCMYSDDEFQETPEQKEMRRQKEMEELQTPCPEKPEILKPPEMLEDDTKAPPQAVAGPTDATPASEPTELARDRIHKDSITTKLKREIPGVAKSMKLSNESLQLATHAFLFIKAVLAIFGAEALLPLPGISRMSKAYLKILINTCTLSQKVIKAL